MEFYFDNAQALDLGTPARKYENNLQAIRLAKEITALGCAASQDEQAILARYVGWGDSALLRLLNGSKELSQLLSEDELRSLRGSSLNAHYTALPVIGAMWDALTFMGFGASPARIIDPSAGVGHFKSLMPISFSADWAEVELDSLTASILKLLHPESRVFAEGYERVDFPRNWFDLAISNVPFGDYGVVKRELPSFLRKSIHDFFFANTVSLLRPGGVLAFITSRYTLDKKDSSVRAWLARHLDLLAAVRLPNNAFKENAGTEVVTDVIFMRKRFEENKDMPDWVETDFLSQNYRQTSINRYFMRNPQMILGVQGMDGTMYKSDGYTVHADDRILADLMKEMLRSVLPENLLNESNEVVYEEHPSHEIEITLSAPKPVDQERIDGLKSIYLTAKKLLQAETRGASLVETSALRHELNIAYDDFTAKYGAINKTANIRLLSGSYEAPFLKALEEYNPTSATAKKADLFSTPLVRSTAQVESPSVDDALLVCLDSKGKVDLSFIAGLSKTTEETVTQQLAGRIFRLPS
ncbi:MAG: hypothetical protein Q7T89_01070, partial [Anaerolineales bacterium]|nr:hypothetical protein [Anaerolineales bacterium]